MHLQNYPRTPDSSRTSFLDTLINQSISPFQVWERRFLYFSREDKQPQFSTQSQINYFSRLSTIKPSPTSPTAAATHGVIEKEEMDFESRKKGNAKMVCGRERLEGVISMQVPVTRGDAVLMTQLAPIREGWSSGKGAPWNDTAPPGHPGERDTQGPSCHTHPSLRRGTRGPKPHARPHLEFPEDEVGVEVQLEGGDELQLLWETGRAAAITRCPRPAPTPAPQPPGTPSPRPGPRSPRRRW